MAPLTSSQAIISQVGLILGIMKIRIDVGGELTYHRPRILEATMASSAIERAQSNGSGWIQSAYDGIQMSLDLINEKRIKVVVNGGAMNPKGLAEKIHDMVKSYIPSSSK